MPSVTINLCTVDGNWEISAIAPLLNLPFYYYVQYLWEHLGDKKIMLVNENVII